MTAQQCPLCGTPLPDDAIACPHCHTNILLARHILNLETRLARLEQQLAKPAPVKTAKSSPRSPRKSPKPALIKPKAPAGPNPLLQSDFWLNKIGIGLLFLAMVFLFRYAVEQGWLTPWIRIIIGLGVGAGLLGLNWRLRKNHHHFSQVLAGGGIAIEYLTGFAALQLYQLVPFWLAMLFMTLVTLLAFALALQQDEAIYSVIGVTGGLLTPFLLDASHLAETAVLAYTLLILLLAGLIYWRRGWQLLLWTALLGSWSILFAVGLDIRRSQRWNMQAGILITLAVAWLLPIYREVIQRARPQRWPAPRFGFADSFIPDSLQALLNSDVYFSTLFSPLIAFILTIATWNLSKESAGWVALIGLGLTILMAYALHRSQARARLVIMHGWISAILLMIAIFTLVHNPYVLLAITLEAAALQLLSWRWHFALPEKIGHYTFWLIPAMGALFRLSDGQQGIPIFNIDALVDLAVIVLVAILFMRKSTERPIFWISAHILFLMWLSRELGAIHNGQALVSAAWGLYALILLGIALTRHARYLRWAGLATLFLLAAKLFLIDLAEVRAIWRVLLFAGIGILFLVISYFYRGFLVDESAPPDEI